MKSSGNQGFRVWEVSTGLPRATSMLQEVGLLLLWLFSIFRVVWLCLSPRGVFGCILNYEKLPYFDPTHYPNFRTCFKVGTKGNLSVCPSREL